MSQTAEKRDWRTYWAAREMITDNEYARKYAKCLRQIICREPKTYIKEEQLRETLERVTDWDSLGSLLDASQTSIDWNGRAELWAKKDSAFIVYSQATGLYIPSPSPQGEMPIPIFHDYLRRMAATLPPMKKRRILAILESDFAKMAAPEHHKAIDILLETANQETSASKVGVRNEPILSQTAAETLFATTGAISTQAASDHTADAASYLLYSHPTKTTDTKESKEPTMSKVNTVINGLTTSVIESSKRTANRAAGLAALQATTSLVFKLLPIKWGWWARVTGRKQAVVQHPFTELAVAVVVNTVARETLQADNKVLLVTQAMQDAALMELLDKNLDIRNVVQKVLEPTITNAPTAE